LFSRAISAFRSQYLASAFWAFLRMRRRVFGLPLPRDTSSLRRLGSPS
jgi:hypothetical protein